jgi:hypothetical protein
MAEVLQSNGLVLNILKGATYVPFACAKTSTITINKEMIELAPKSNSIYRRYMQGRASFTMTGDGLIKLNETASISFDFFDSFIEGTDTVLQGMFSVTDPQGNYKKYSFYGYFSQLTLDSTIGSIPSYSFTIQGDGGFTEIP